MIMIVKCDGEIPRDSTGSVYVFPHLQDARDWIDDMETENVKAGGKPIGLATVEIGPPAFYCGTCEKPFLTLDQLTAHMDGTACEINAP